MNWNKAKNFIIIFLLLVNAILLVLNIGNSKKTVLNQEAINDLTKVLNNSGIVLSCELPTKYSAMATLGIESYEYDLIKLQKIFFGDVTDVKRSEEFEYVIFSKDNKNLKIKNNRIEFNDKIAEGVDDINKATEIADGYEKGLKLITDGMSVESIREFDEGYNILYVKKNLEYTLFSSYISVTIGKNGDINLVMEFLTPQDFNSEKNSIISASEAVFSVIKNIQNDFDEGYVKITDVELGYYTVSTDDNGGVGTIATPHYRIAVNNGGGVYFVSAYSGSVSE